MQKKLANLSAYLPNLAPVILLMGAALRLSGLLTSSIWYDEAFSLNLARQDLFQMIRLSSTDFNPPLWEMLVWPFLRILPDVLALRLPALLASLASLWLCWKIMLTLGLTPIEQVAGALLISLMPGLLWTAQDGRVYALFTLLFLIGFYLALDAHWMGLVAVCGLMCYAHNMGPFYALPLLFVAAYRMRASTKTRLAHINVAFILMLVSFSPWLPSYLSSSNTNFWLGPLDVANFLASIGQAWFAASLPLPLAMLGTGLVMAGLVLAVVFWSQQEKQKPVFVPVETESESESLNDKYETINYIRSDWYSFPTWLKYNIWKELWKALHQNEPLTLQITPNTALLAAAIGPLLLMTIYSLAGRNVLFYRPLGPLVIPMCLVMALYLTPRRLTRTTWVLPYLWAMLLLAGLAGYNSIRKGGEMELAASAIQAAWQPGDVVYYATGTAALPMREYLPPQTEQYLLDETQPPALLDADLAAAFGLVSANLDAIPHQRAWLIWPRDPVMTPAAQKRFQDLTSSATLVMRLQYPQAAPIEIYLEK